MLDSVPFSSMAHYKLNERYYALNEGPNFRKFGKNYHFTDEKGRLYRIAEQDQPTFPTPKYRATSVRKETNSIKRPVVTNYNEVKLYVKLPTAETPWFGYSDRDKSFYLIDQDDDTLDVRLRYFQKSTEKRRTGVVRVSGLNRVYCEELLNRSF